MDSAGAELTVLMIAALDGDAGAYRALLRALRPRLSGFFGRRLQGGAADTEDLVQETLIAIHTRRETFDRAQALLPWAYAIARYKLIDHYRRGGRRVFVPVEEAVDELRVEDASAAADARRDVEIALASLSPKTRSLIRDVKLNELSTAQAADRAGMSEGAAKVAVHRGLKAMSSRFGLRSATGD